MAQAEFPPGITMDIPPEEDPVREIIRSALDQIFNCSGSDEEKRKDSTDAF